MSLIFDQYSERLKRKNRSPHTVSGFATASTRLDRWLGAQGIAAEDASYPVLEEYFDTMELGQGTKATHMRHIKAAYNYAVKRGALRHNPALDLELPEPDPREPRTIPTETLREIKAGVRYQRDWLFFNLLAYTGMRRSEIRGLVWDDGESDGRSVVQLDKETIRVWGKGRKRRLVPIHPALGEVLAKEGVQPGRFVIHSEGREGVAIDTIQRMVKRLHPVYTPHDYRRTVMTSLGNNGVPDHIIDKVLGWSPDTIRERFYRNVAPPELHQAILRLYADDPI